jgi:hypothetical protein
MHDRLRLPDPPADVGLACRGPGLALAHRGKRGRRLLVQPGLHSVAGSRETGRHDHCGKRQDGSGESPECGPGRVAVGQHLASDGQQQQYDCCD